MVATPEAQQFSLQVGLLWNWRQSTNSYYIISRNLRLKNKNSMGSCERFVRIGALCDTKTLVTPGFLCFNRPL